MGPTYLHYDYANQVWVRNGEVQDCGHPKEMDCGCYGRLHAGKAHTCNHKCYLTHNQMNLGMLDRLKKERAAQSEARRV